MTDWIKKIKESDAGKNDERRVKMLVDAVAEKEEGKKLRLPPLSWRVKENE